MLEETKRKISESRKGRKPMLGHYHSEETKKRISENSAKFWLGKKFSDKTKKKMSERMKGHKINLGKHHTEEAKEKMRKAHLGKKKSKETKEKLSKVLKGRKLSKEWRMKIGLANKGKKSNFWKGGISKENERIRKGIEFRLWREAVFARDNYTCQKTGIKGGKLHSHHIYNFADYPKLRFAIDNGITLCEKAHKEFHRKYGYKNNKEQILLYLK